MPKVNFDEILKMRNGSPIYEKSIDRSMAVAAEKLEPGSSQTLQTIAEVLEKNGETISSIIRMAGNPFTLRSVCVDSLDMELELDERTGRPKASGKERREKARLADRIYGAKEPINLTSEEIVLLKTAVERRFSSNLLYYQVCYLLEPDLAGADEKVNP